GTAFAAAEPTTKDSKPRKDAFGDFEVVRRDYGFTHLYTIDVGAALDHPQPGTPRTRGRDFNVSSFSWSPDASRIAFSATLNPDLIQGSTSDIYVLTLADDKVAKIVDLPGPDGGPLWSPDGTQIVFSSQM